MEYKVVRLSDYNDHGQLALNLFAEKGWTIHTIISTPDFHLLAYLERIKE